MKNPEGCMQRAGRPKTASGMTVYLMEELGDARLNCAQLTHYIDLARQIVEKSDKRDHIYEVAGHLLQAIPEHLFKLEKSLQAVALAADRIDYEEIKQDLKPEKVEELERVMKDVRIRNVPHRSEPRTPMNPMQAAEDLQKIATEIRTAGKVPVGSLLTLIASLEGQDRTASDVTATADILEEIGKALLKPASSNPPKRLQLAATLRKIAADHLACDEMNACNMMSEEDSSAEEAARRSRFEKNQPADPTQNMDPAQKKEWEQKNDENKDNFKESANWGEGGFTQFTTFLERMVGGVEEAAKQMRHSLEVYKRDPGKNAPQLGNFYREVGSLTGQMKVLQRAMPKDIVFASENKVQANKWKVSAKEPEFEVGDIVRPSKSYLRSLGPTTKIQNGVVKGKDGRFYKVQWNHRDDAVAVAPAALELDPRHKGKKEKVAAGRTMHLAGKAGHTLCGETAHADTTTDDYRDCTCFYCKQAWEKKH